jgi:hypothetical protein
MDKRKCEVNDANNNHKARKFEGVENGIARSSSPTRQLQEDHPVAVGSLPSSASSSIRAASRKTRVYIFREFVKKHYDLEPGAVVLDIAGGKGDLSWLLRNVDGWNSIVVDPRVTKSDHILRSIQYLREHPDEAKERATPGLPTYQPLAQLLPKLGSTTSFQTPRHFRLFVDAALVHAVQRFKEDADEKKWNIYWEEATNRAKGAQPLQQSTEILPNERATIQEGTNALRFLLSTKLILGFHPDQATDHAIDLALALGIPYCIVPCCVFPRENTHRQIADGSPVKKYPQLIKYLKEKYGSESSYLPFHFTETAKNLVLFSKICGLQMEPMSHR